jgi:hypothetical protein
MNRMTVALFPNRATAQPLQQRLADSGVHAEIHNELKLEKLWFVSKHNSGVRLEVPCNEFEKAERLMNEPDVEPKTSEAIHCPECGSLRIQYPQVARKSLLTNFFMGLAAEAGIVARNYYCEDCHCTWPHDSTPPKVRLHSAPYYFIKDPRKSGGAERQSK